MARRFWQGYYHTAWRSWQGRLLGRLTEEMMEMMEMMEVVEMMMEMMEVVEMMMEVVEDFLMVATSLTNFYPYSFHTSPPFHSDLVQTWFISSVLLTRSNL
jgi:hypothetical protein